MKWIEKQQVKLKETMMNWERIFKVGQQQVFGLDIGSSAIKMVQLQKNGDNYVVTAAGITDIEGVAEGDDGRKEINIPKAIHQCLLSSGVQTKLAVCGVCGPETAVRGFKFPLLSPDEIEGAVLLEAKQVCPFNTDDGVIDYQVIPGDNKDTSGILVVATKKLLKEKTRFTENAIISNVLVDVDGLALLNCFRGCQTSANSTEPKYEAGQTIAILNVGNSCATLAIISDDNLPFVRDIHYVGREIIEHITLKHNISAGNLEGVVANRENPDKIRPGIHDDLKTAWHKLIIDITETLRYYAVRSQSEMVERIFVCGGFTLVEGFMDLLNSQLPAATVLWNPFDTISYDADMPCADILRKKGPALAVAAGFAMRTI